VLDVICCCMLEEELLCVWGKEENNGDVDVIYIILGVNITVGSSHVDILFMFRYVDVWGVCTVVAHFNSRRLTYICACSQTNVE
jgi:hypothetical protein